MRVLTGLPDELPDPDPELALVRVLTGVPDEPDPPEDPPRPLLVRVVTGAPADDGGPEWEPLARVLIPPAPVVTAVEWWPEAPVLGAPATLVAAVEPDPPCRGPAPAMGWCLTIWIVRRITTVRTSTGFRDATVSAVFEGVRNASTASVAAVRAAAAAMIRV